LSSLPISEPLQPETWLLFLNSTPTSFIHH
jgi:hypothetical protein